MSAFENSESLGAQNRIDAIRSLVRGISQQSDVEKRFGVGEVILEQGQVNDELLILVKGDARLIKTDDDGHSVEIDAFSAGSILGLTSFWRKQAVFARIEATSDAICLAIPRQLWNETILGNPELMMSIQALFVSNLSSRYRNLIQIHIDRDRLSRQLECERNHLKDTLIHLERMTNRLVNQERLATMGQLVAGIAHEINNPVGALTRNIAMASGALTSICSKGDDRENETIIIKEGLSCPFWATEEKRQRMDALAVMYPNLERSQVRRLAQLTDKAQEVATKSIKKSELLERYLAIYELGVCFRSASISSTRIESIVKGLKNYSRQTGSPWDDADVKQGIQDTLTVLGNRLKNYELDVALEDCPLLNCNLGEINQVWTNLLTNAMDATPIRGWIRVACRLHEDQIVVEVEDSGSGIPEEKRSCIFEANYTTKNKSGSFGLGLGLTISKEIIEKHGGRIEVRSSVRDGACFEVWLPLKND